MKKTFQLVSAISLGIVIPLFYYDFNIAASTSLLFSLNLMLIAYLWEMPEPTTQLHGK